MGTGYTRNDTANNIADGNVINASDLDGEFDAVQAAFNGTTGHSHDGTTGEGPQIAAGGIASNAVTTAKILDANVTTAKIADLNVTTGKIANDAVTLGTKTSGNYVAAGAVSGVGLSGSASAEGATFTVTSNATNANTASTIVARDASGNFSAGTITASLTGNVTGTASNAALLDNIDSTSFLRSDTADTKTAGDLTFSDNVKAKFGGGGDLEIYHDNPNGRSVIADVGVGDLEIHATDFSVKNATRTSTYMGAVDGGAVTLRYAGVTKLATASGGVDITGNITVSGTVDGRDVASDGSKLDGIESGATADQTASEILTLIKTVDGAGSGLDADTLDGVSSASFLRSDAADTKTSGSLTFSDNISCIFGAGSDLSLFHDGVGGGSYINEAGTGDLFIQGQNIQLRKYGTSEVMADFNVDGAVDLYHNNINKMSTTTDGISVSGNVTATSGGFIGASSGDKIIVGANDIDFYINSSNEFRMESDGDFHADGDVIAFSTTVSDERLKTDIEKIENATDKVSQLNGYTFTYKADGKKSAGVIAQEVEKVLPSAVSEKELPLKMDDGVAYKTVQYDQIIGLLIESIKELKQEINELKGN